MMAAGIVEEHGKQGRAGRPAQRVRRAAGHGHRERGGAGQARRRRRRPRRAQPAPRRPPRHGPLGPAAGPHRGQARDGPAGGRAPPGRAAGRAREGRGQQRRPRPHAQPVAMNPARAAVEFANTLLTTEDAEIGTTPRDVVWTHRKVTLYRYRSDRREHAVPVLLVFALINRPTIFDLRQGNSFVAYLLHEGCDVSLRDWGEPDDEAADMGLEAYTCDELPWGIRETLRAAGADEVSLLGWCIGGTLCAMHCALARDTVVRNLVLLTTPIDTTGSRYTRWVGRDSFDV